MRTVWIPIKIAEAYGVGDWTHAMVEDEDLAAILAAVPGSSATVPEDCKTPEGKPKHVFAGREGLDT